MEDDCIFCNEHLATVTSKCGHRWACHPCFARSRAEGASSCPYCRKAVVSVSDSTTVQLRPTLLEDMISDCDAFKEDYPFGYLLLGTSERIADKDMYTAVKQAVAAVEAKRLNLNKLKSALRSRLTMEQYQIVFVELMKKQDLHDILQKLDNRKFEKVENTRIVQELIVHTVESTDNRAIALRAIATTTGDAVVRSVLQASHFSAPGAAANGIGSVIMFSLFSALELYRYSKGELTGVETAKNIGEHFIGGIGGFAGAAGGGAAGAAIGSVVPVIGTVIGGIVGGVIGGLIGGILGDGFFRWVYRKIVPGKREEYNEREIKEQQQLSAKDVVNRAAGKFGINVDVVSFSSAHEIFRRMLLVSHPDKHPNAPPEELERLNDETRDIMACWQIVREYYNEQGKIVGSDCEEGFIKAYTLKVKDAATNVWLNTRMFFNNMRLGRDVDPQTERIEEVTFYL